MKLFKYMQLTPKPKNFESESEKVKIERDRIKQIFVDHKVYFSKPSKLNDIFEFKPCIQIPKSYEKRKELAKHRAKTLLPNASRPKRRELTKILFKKVHQMKSPEFSNEKFWEWLDGYGVFCLSTRPNSPIMWSHYASIYKGICICFNCPTPVEPDLGLLNAVIYQAEYPMFDLMTLNSKEEQDSFKTIDVVFTKSDEWIYEKEYRFIKGPFEGGYGSYKFDPRKITEIILGPLIEEKEKKFIIETVRQGLKSIAVYSSKISKTKYSIDKDKRVN